jgi:hypothetical protein
VSTQADTVLAMLRSRGTRGVHTFELRRQYIGNPSQRIAELEARGHRITHTREKLNGTATGTRYVLTVDADSSGAAVPPTLVDSPVAAPEGLFPIAPTSPYRGDAA